MKLQKTNVMRILDAMKIPYRVYTYDPKKLTDHISLANQIDQDVTSIYKTIVLESGNDHYVAVIPVSDQLDMKAVASGFNIKKISLLHPNRLTQVSGYVRGGCSPIGMKKTFPTIIDSTALECETIIVSAGKVGLQIGLTIQDLKKVIDCLFYPICQ